jgi:Short C-terminal domain
VALSDELSKLPELRAGGMLTEEEFTRAKERLLNAGASRSEEPVVSAYVKMIRHLIYQSILVGGTSLLVKV